MGPKELDRIFTRLEGHCILTDGLRDTEIENVETSHGFRFPPDLRALLQFKLPVSGGFTDWRNETFDQIQRRLSDPIEGVLVDIGNGFWFDGWGERPAETIAAFELAFSKIGQVPLLIPVCGLDFLPASPCIEGNPVFLVDGTNVSCCASHLASYFENAFLRVEAPPDPTSIRRRARQIAFWSNLAFQA